MRQTPSQGVVRVKWQSFASPGDIHVETDVAAETLGLSRIRVQERRVPFWDHRLIRRQPSHVETEGGVFWLEAASFVDMTSVRTRSCSTHVIRRPACDDGWKRLLCDYQLMRFQVLFYTLVRVQTTEDICLRGLWASSYRVR